MSKRKYLTEDQVEKQEHLSGQRLINLRPKYGRQNFDHTEEGFSDTIGMRPESNLIDLMHWVKAMFSKDIGINGSNYVGLNLFIHNKIVIDGSFLQFAEETGVSVECLYKDSIASWRSDKKFEHFMAQGVFKISKDNVQFLHAALFHKGNQNEDEVSFFVVVHDDQYDDYISLRNEFDDWLTKRDREHLEINVIDGEGIPYERDMPWDEVFLPDDLKSDIRATVEGFLNSKKLYEEKKIAWKRGILLYGDPGNGKTTTIRTIISNYDFKPVTVQSSRQTNDETITEAFSYAQQQEPGLLYIEDLDTLLSTTVSVSHFLNLLDGVAMNSGILVIATANDLSKLGEAVTNRPSRFDRKILVPLPDKEMSKKYLYHWFNDAFTDDEYNEIVSKTVDMNFSYAYLKELYLSSAYHAVAKDRSSPNLDDVNTALEQLLRDKDAFDAGFESDSHEGIGIS